MYPAGEPGITVRRETLPGGLGLRVLYAGPDSGPTVLLVHGWSASVYTFAELIPALARAGFRVVALDLPGHGLSDKPVDDSVYTIPRLANAVVALMDVLGLRRVAVVAHSMGGAIALELAGRADARVSSLALCNPVGLGRVPFMPALRLASPRVVNGIVPRLLSRGVIAAALRIAFGTSQRPNPRDVDEYWAPTQFPAFAWACRALVHGVRWRPLSAVTLRGLRLPVLVITGGRDLLVRGAERRAHHLPFSRVVRISEGGHLVLQECAARTLDALVPFLRESVTSAG